MKRIGVMTSGGDCPGMNAAIRSVVRTSLAKGIEVFGIEQGFRGLLEDNMRPLISRNVANTIQMGGTFLRSARCKEFLTKEGQDRGAEILLKRGIEGLVVIGGDGSLAGANVLHENYGIKALGVPGSIDNDIFGTDISIGVDTALNTIVRSIDMINDTASSHDRTFLVEVMGRHSGYLAVTSAIAGGAEAILIPEVPYNLEGIIDKIKRRYAEGKSRSVVIVAEGVGSAYDFGKTFQLMGGFDTRITVLGHIQRGGAPSVFDRTLGTRLGSFAVESLVNGESGKMAALQKTQMTLVPLSEVCCQKKSFDQKLLEIAEMLSH